ncbi:MAG: hypothetical protein ACR2QC_08650 [Gammaproteobacteria bacterium]
MPFLRCNKGGGGGMFNSLYLRVKFAFCSVVLGAIFALTGAAFAAENFAAADKNAAENDGAKIGEGFRYSDYLQYDEFNSSTKTEFSAHPFSLNPEPFDLPAEEFGAAEGGGGLIEFLSSPLGGFVIAAGIFAGATAIDKNNRDDNTPSTAVNGGTTQTPQCSDGMVADRNGDCVVEQSCTATGEEMDGFGGCQCSSGHIDVGGSCVMQQVCTTGEIADGIGGCQCDTANDYVDDGAGMCVMQQVCPGQFVADGFGGCGCPAGSSEDPPGSGMCVADSELALRAMCATDSALERRIFAAAAGDIDLTLPALTVNPSSSIAEIYAAISDAVGIPWTLFFRRNADGSYLQSLSANLDTGLPGFGVDNDSLDEGDVIVLWDNAALGSPAAVAAAPANELNIFRVYESGGEFFFARNENTGGPNRQRTACTAGAGEFFLDDNWMPTQNLGDSRMTFPFNLREGLRGLLDEKHAVRLKNFFFTANDSQLRDFHLEHRFHLFGEADESTTGESPNSSGFSAFAESGYKRQNGGRTALHYNKLTAIRDFTSGFAIYVQGVNGRINSEIYRNTRLRGFAAGIFADKVLSHDDSYHLRIESPLSAPQIARTRMAIDARIGEPENYWRIGFYRSLEDKESAAKLFWLREF